MLAKSYPQLREIVGELKQINLVDEVRAFFDDRIKERRDRRAIEGYIREQAFTEGHDKGHADGMTAGEAKGLADGMTLGEAKGHADGEAEREQLRQEVERLNQENERLKAQRDEYARVQSARQ
jgi:flagellar biosynthesis/type III secretory pathway protein FliH